MMRNTLPPLASNDLLCASMFLRQPRTTFRAIFSLVKPRMIIRCLPAGVAKNSISDIDIRNERNDGTENQNDGVSSDAENNQKEKKRAVSDGKATTKSPF